jgi:subtilisin family serine protease
VTRAFAPLLALLVLLTSALPVLADEPEEPELETSPIAPEAEYASDRVVVRYHDAGKAPDAAARSGLSVLASLETPGAPVVLGTRGRDVDAVLAELRADPAVEWAEPDYVVELADEGEVTAVAVNDPLTAQQYSLNRMRVRDAWSITKGTTDDVVAVLDTGVQANHPELSGRVLTGYDFVNGDTNAADDNGHGTWVAGIVAANTNNGAGIAGISWNARILPVKIMNRNGTGSTSALNSGITWVANWAAARPDKRVVINMSVGGFPYSQFVNDAVNYAVSKGVVLVGAAGNNRREEDFYPASYANVISVSATQADDEFTNWSSFGPKVDVSAPGASVLTTNCTVSPCVYHSSGGYITISGTSFATPNVAGVVSLIRAKNPSWSASQVVNRLYATVDDIGYPGKDKWYGRGRVNAWRAVGGSPPSIGPSTGDGLEPNNALASAKRLTFDATVRPSIHPAGDLDFFYVDVPAAGRVTFTVTAVTDTVRVPKSSLPIDPVVSLYDAGGAHLKTVDSANAAATEVAWVEVGSTGRLYARIRNWYPNGNKAAYSIRPTFTLLNGGFGDVANSPFLNDIIWLVDSGVTKGCAADRFCPLTSVTRGQMAAFLVRFLKLAPASTNYFSDDNGHQFEGNINALAASGITGGCSASAFCPNRNVTRGEMAAFLVRALKLPNTSVDYFADDRGHPFENAINRLAASGITGGCSATAYCADKTITREQMAAFLHRADKLRR